MKQLRCVSALLLLAVVSACKRSGPDPDGGSSVTNTARLELLAAAGKCATNAARDFDTHAAALVAATQTLTADPSDPHRDAARQAFHDAMTSWQVAEGLRFGPAAPRSFPGGRDLRDHIYSWPLVSRCAVEETLVSQGYSASDFANALTNRRGLATLEYLLFYEGSDTACPASSPIVANGTWAALGAPELAARKRAYAAAAATELRARASSLLAAWDPAADNFEGTLATPGAGNATFGSSLTALNAVSDALFYLEHEVKDLKLAVPLGLRDCASETCPELLESRYAHRAKTNVRANLAGFRKLAEGCDGAASDRGFDDLLEAAGAAATAQHLRDSGAEALAALDAIEEADLDETLTNDRASFQTLYDRFKALSDLLKTELVTVLDLEIPLSLEGDND